MLGGEGVASWRLLEIHILVRLDKDGENSVSRFCSISIYNVIDFNSYCD